MQLWIFWAAVTALAAGVAYIMAQALRRAPVVSDDSALKVYRDQLAEVDRDLARGTLPATEADRLKTEVSRRLLDADRAQKSEKPIGGNGSALPAYALITLTSLAALAGYNWLGAPGYGDLPLTTRLANADDAYRNRPSQAQSESTAPKSVPVTPDAAFADLMDKLRAAVTANPDDQQGLTLLAENEAKLGNYISSRTAYEHLVTLKADQSTSNDHAGLAQTMIFAAGGTVSPEAEKHLIRALELDPTNPTARYFSGLMFAEIGRPDRAFGLWEPLLREGPPDAPWITPIRSLLQQTADAAGIKYQMPADAPDSAAKGPTTDDVTAAQNLSAEDRQAMIKTMVAQLESRLTTEGGPVADWVKLITALGVLGEKTRAKTVYDQALIALKSDDAALGQIEEAASKAGVTP
jgi:cytochrome c-type biogenesis protein CcmH